MELMPKIVNLMWIHRDPNGI